MLDTTEVVYVGQSKALGSGLQLIWRNESRRHGTRFQHAAAQLAKEVATLELTMLVHLAEAAERDTAERNAAATRLQGRYRGYPHLAQLLTPIRQY